MPDLDHAALVGNRVPRSVIIEIGRFIRNIFIDISDGAAVFLEFLRPEGIPCAVPIVPILIDVPAARENALSGNNDGSGPRRDVVTGGILVRDEISLTLDGDDFCGFITHIKIEIRSRLRDDIPVRGRGLEDRIGTAVVKTGDSRSHIDGSHVRLEGHELNLCTPSDPHPCLVGKNELGLAVRSRIKSVVEAEGAVLCDGDPVVVGLYISQKCFFHEVDAPDEHSFPAGLCPCRDESRQDRNDQYRWDDESHCPPPVFLLHNDPPENGEKPEKRISTGVAFTARGASPRPAGTPTIRCAR